VTMMLALITSPRKAETQLASSKMMISGLRNRRRSCTMAVIFRTPTVSLGPISDNRRCASCSVKPRSDVCNCSKRSCNGRDCTPPARSGGSIWESRCTTCGATDPCMLYSFSSPTVVNDRRDYFDVCNGKVARELDVRVARMTKPDYTSPIHQKRARPSVHAEVFSRYLLDWFPHELGNEVLLRPKAGLSQ
jgi:hypothetical protein